MDFFQHQDEARKKTGRMIFMFALAVIMTVLALNAVFAGIYMYTAGEMHLPVQGVTFMDRLKVVPPQLWYYVTGITLVIILGGSIFRILQLDDGGPAVAEMVGARKVARNTTDFGERRLLNVVDEMAIASGVVVPQVYIMDDEPGINAFAAGYKPNEAVIAVTAGAVKELSREELQGVIAHEYSHIFNGDMRLNIRLMGVLHGILIIGVIGSYLLRSMSRSSGRSRNGDGAAAMFGVALALVIIGYTGVFFGRLIKAGVSRQREYLADSSAVQYTRNPDGLTGALKKIGKLDEGSTIYNEHAEELSHMYFSQGVVTMMDGLMATHPPLIDRIKRINRGRVPKSPAATRKKVEQARHANLAEEQVYAQANAMGTSGVAESIGNPSHAHVLYAAALLSSIPQPVSDALAIEEGSRALVFALVLDSNPEVRQKELEALAQTPFASLQPEVLRLADELEKLHARYRLPLFDLAMPTLKAMDVSERESLLTSLKQVIDADRRIKLDELTIYILVRAHLKPGAGRKESGVFTSLSELEKETALLLSLLSFLGKSETHPPAAVFSKAASGLRDLLPDIDLVELKDFHPDDLVEAMEKFVLLTPTFKEKITSACLQAVLLDEDVTIQELEVMRGLCASMEVPVPPVLLDKDGNH